MTADDVHLLAMADARMPEGAIAACFGRSERWVKGRLTKLRLPSSPPTIAPTREPAPDWRTEERELLGFCRAVSEEAPTPPGPPEAKVIRSFFAAGGGISAEVRMPTGQHVSVSTDAWLKPDARVELETFRGEWRLRGAA